MRCHPATRTAITLILIPFAAAQVPGPQGTDAQRGAVAAAAKPAIQMDATTIILPPGNVGARELVDAAAKFLGRNILLDELEVVASGSGQVKLQNAMRLEKPGFEEVFCDLLHSCHMVVMVRDEPKGLYEVVSLTGMRSREAFQSAPNRSVEEILRRPTLKQPVSTMMRLHRINPVVATNTLRPLFAGGSPGSLTAGIMPGNDGMILAGLQSEVARAIGILREAEGDPPEATGEGGGERLAVLEQQIAALQRELAELKQRLAAKADEKR
jgi:hypothetical protein